MLKRVTCSLQADRRALEDILASSPDCLLAVSFDETSHTLHKRVDRVRVFLEKPDFFSRSPYQWQDSNLPYPPWRWCSFNFSEWFLLHYLSLLQNTVWSNLWYAVTRSSFWWIQDGTPIHCTNSVLAFLNEKFWCWVLSWITANPRSAHSTDFNLLDFYFWAAAQNQDFQGNT